MPTGEMRVIHKISDIMAQATDYREALRLTVECIAKELAVDACSILVHREESDELVLEATYGLEQENVARLRLPADSGITGTCFRLGQMIHVPRMSEHPAHKPFPGRRAAEYQALLAIPLLAAGRAIGVLDFAARKPERFSDATVTMAQAMASPLAVYILNAKLTRALEAAPKTRERTSAELILKGRPITDGVVRGPAHLLPSFQILEAVAPAEANDLSAERTLLKRALVKARQETKVLQEEASEILAEADAGIFFAHLLLLEDPLLIERLDQALEQGMTLRYALRRVAEEFASDMQKMPHEVLRERTADIKDVILRILYAVDRLEGVARDEPTEGTAADSTTPIMIARELLPSQLIRIPLAHLAGVVCEEGGTTTHVAILAKALQIPMVVGVAGALDQIHQDDDLILDCSTGSCYVRPSQTVLERFQPALVHHRQKDETAIVFPPAPAQTADGAAVRLSGNISLISELPLLQRYGALGIGLYRTEFMFMIRGTYPAEDEQYNIFRQVVEVGGESPVTVRILDVGGDKPLPYVDFGAEDNPFLGWRGLRFMLTNPQFMEPHLRAILRTTLHGKVNILLPMVADLEELLLAREMLEKAKKTLDRDGIPYNPDYALGVMLEVPAAIWSLAAMLPYIDFVSIGTNDLIQYTFAVDRGNNRVTRWFRQFHPVVLRLIKETCDIVHAVPGKTVSLCGEMAGIALGAPFLIGCGLRDLSMNPWRIPAVRAVIEDITVADCEALAAQALECFLDADIVTLMQGFAEQHGLKS